MTNNDLEFMSFIRDKLGIAYSDFLLLAKPRRSAIRRIWNMRVNTGIKVNLIQELGII